MRVSVPSWASVMLLTIARPSPTPAWSVRMRSLPRRNGSTSVATSSGVSGSPVFATVSTTNWPATLVVTHTVPPAGRLWTIALWTRFVHSCSSSVGEPTVRVSSPDESIVRPCSSAKGRSDSVASSAISDRSTGSRANDRWSARVSSSSASVRSIARVLTA